MKTEQFIFIYLMLGVGLLSCRTNNQSDNIPNMTLAREFGIDSTQLMYQYYQKFGFTEVCEDVRMIARQRVSPKLAKNLPIDERDLHRINRFPNKTDRLGDSEISIHLLSGGRSELYDVELDFIEFSVDSLLTIQLEKGEYEIIQGELASTVKIYDLESKLLYVETHRCDGN